MKSIFLRRQNPVFPADCWSTAFLPIIPFPAAFVVIHRQVMRNLELSTKIAEEGVDLLLLLALCMCYPK